MIRIGDRVTFKDLDLRHYSGTVKRIYLRKPLAGRGYKKMMAVMDDGGEILIEDLMKID